MFRWQEANVVFCWQLKISAWSSGCVSKCRQAEAYLMAICHILAYPACLECEIITAKHSLTDATGHAQGALLISREQLIWERMAIPLRADTNMTDSRKLLGSAVHESTAPARCLSTAFSNQLQIKFSTEVMLLHGMSRWGFQPCCSDSPVETHSCSTGQLPFAIEYLQP